jgi:hypothetical protein
MTSESRMKDRRWLHRIVRKSLTGLRSASDARCGWTRQGSVFPALPCSFDRIGLERSGRHGDVLFEFLSIRSGK